MNTPNGASNNSGNYMNAPLYMSMNMHMFGVICAPRNNYTNAYVRINLKGNDAIKNGNVRRRDFR